VRYLVVKKSGGKVRYYWQPSAKLRELGWHPQSLPNDRTEAIVHAELLNAKLDAARKNVQSSAPSLSTLPVATIPAVAKKQISENSIRPGSIAWLIRTYRASHKFTELADKTKADYGYHLRTIEDLLGDYPIQKVTPLNVDMIYNSLRVQSLSTANYVIRVLRLLLGHAVRLRLIQLNPAARPDLRDLPFSGQYWPLEAFVAFVDAADRLGLHSVGTAIVINHWLGQRENDILRLRRHSWRNGRFHLRQSKTEKMVSIPETPLVKARVEEELARQAARGVVSTTHLLLCEVTGQPWKQRAFQRAFRAVRDAVKLEKAEFKIDDDNSAQTEMLDFQHLRHTAVTELANAGCSVPEIASITGHELDTVHSILKRYLVMTSALADSASMKRLQAGNGGAPSAHEAAGGSSKS
jgi:hypothetical protein